MSARLMALVSLLLTSQALTQAARIIDSDEGHGRTLLQENGPMPAPVPNYGGSASQPSPAYEVTGAPVPSYGAPTYATPAAYPPACLTPSSCLTVNVTEGGALDAYQLDASSWVSGMPAFPSLVYEFGVMEMKGSGEGAIATYTARQSYSASSTATLEVLPVGTVDCYVCVRAANPRSNAVGPRACATTRVTVSANVSEQQLDDQIAALTAFTTKVQPYTQATVSRALELTQRLVILAAMANSTANGTASSNSTTNTTANPAIGALASNMLGQIVASSLSAAATANAEGSLGDSTSSTLAAFGAFDSLWTLASSSSKAAVVNGVGALSVTLGSQALSPEDAQPAVNFFTTMLNDASDLVTASAASAANGTNTSASNTADAARVVLTSFTRGATALTRGLLNGAPADGTPARIATARLAAAVQRASAALAGNGLSVKLTTPSGEQSAAGRRRHMLAAGDFSSSAQVSVSLNPGVGALCSADTTCSSAGLGFTIIVISDPSLLLSALGGSAASLGAGLPDYRTGANVQIISPIVRVAAPGLPTSAFALSNLVALELPVNVTAVNQDGATTKRALVRLQDSKAAAADAGAGISANASTTVTSTSNAADMISGYSNALGDYVVVQYGSTSAPNGGAAGPALLPSALLIFSTVLGAASLLLL